MKYPRIRIFLLTFDMISVLSYPNVIYNSDYNNARFLLPHTPIECFNNLPFKVYRGSFSGVREPQHEVYHPSPSSAEVRMNEAETLIPLHVYMAWTGTLLPLLTYLLTPWSRVLLEKLTGSAASQEIPAFYGIRKFITVLTSARHLSLS
jgi:hypothetical protein